MGIATGPSMESSIQFRGFARRLLNARSVGAAPISSGAVVAAALGTSTPQHGPLRPQTPMNTSRLQSLSTAIMPQVCRPRPLKTSNCTSPRPWTATVALVVASAELMPAELGEKTFTSDPSHKFLSFLGISHLAPAFPSLSTTMGDIDGTAENAINRTRVERRERATLERWARRPKSAQALASRCRIVLACAEGGNNIEVGARLGVGRHTWASGGIASWRIDLMA